MWLSLISVVLMGAIAAYVYKLFFSSSKDIFKEYGIREIDTSVVGSKLDFIFGRKGAPEADAYAYNLMGSEKYCGISDMMSQMILIKDMELIKKVLIKDFDHFVDRRDFEIENAVLTKMLPSLKGEEWQNIRKSVSPTFTTGKIRRMMEIFNSVGINALQCVNQYSIDCIASAVFGLSPGTIKDENSMFAKYATRLTDFTKWKLIKMILCVGFPKFAKIFNLSFFDEETVAFFTSILDQGFKARISGTTAKRNDFLQLLVEAKKGELKAEGKDELSKFEKDAQIETGGEKKQWLTERIMNSQSLAFFFAGFSTTSNLISCVSYALSLHQDVQERLRNEVSTIVKEDGTFDYDDLATLVYMDMVVCEILRIYPAAARIERVCLHDYKDTETGLFIPKGATAAIPVNSMHNDKQYYENPERFDPENFSPDKKTQRRNPYAYLPFGIGPRNCIGMRFGLVKSKAAIAHLVYNFKVEPTNRTPIPMEVHWTGIQAFPPKGLELKLIPLK